MSRGVKKPLFDWRLLSNDTRTFRDRVLIYLPFLIDDANTHLHSHPEELEELDEDERQRALRVPNGA